MATCMTDESRFKCIRTTIARSDSIRDYQYVKHICAMSLDQCKKKKKYMELVKVGHVQTIRATEPLSRE